MFGGSFFRGVVECQKCFFPEWILDKCYHLTNMVNANLDANFSARKNVSFWFCAHKATKVKYNLWLVLNGNGVNDVGFQFTFILDLDMF